MPILNPPNDDALLRLAAGIVSAYIKSNSVSQGDLPRLISIVYSALTKLFMPVQIAAIAPFKPAVSARKSVTDEYIICLEDGKRFKSLKRHLRAHFGMSPDDYRDKWGLGRDYPMVAPNYARARSDLAKSMGLGQQRRHRA